MIYLLGDVHGRMDHVLPALRDRGDQTVNVIFLGDIESPRPFEDEIRPLIDAGIGVWFIHGNHDSETPSYWDHLQGSTHRNLHGRIVDIEGVRVAGLGGVFRGDAWYPDRPGIIDGAPRNRNYEEYVAKLKAKTPPRQSLSPAAASNALKHRATIFPDTYDLLAGGKADMLVTHEAPSCHPNGFKTIDRLAQALGVKSAFHGHHHDSLNYQAWEASLGFRAHGVGLREVMNALGRPVPPSPSR